MLGKVMIVDKETRRQVNRPPSFWLGGLLCEYQAVIKAADTRARNPLTIAGGRWWNYRGNRATRLPPLR
jgi:hypothetical protein